VPQKVTSLPEHFSRVADPRVDRTKQHLLIDILVMAICAVICGADDWVAVAAFGRAKQEWFKTFLRLPNGIPSHDTFGRVFARLDPQQFQQAFMAWIQAVSDLTHSQVVAIDGKKLRRSHDQRLGKQAIVMVSAWATANRLVLGQVKTDDKSNEITAIPELLRVLALEGCIVTVDALGCQTEIATAIVAQGGDYLLAVKENQKLLYQDLRDLFHEAQAAEFRETVFDFARTVSKGHGRLEIRRCWTIADPDFLDYIRDGRLWPNLGTLIMIESERRRGRKISREVRYFIASIENDAALALRAVRGHWGIENRLHWVLDIAFREDDCRVRKDHGPQNFAVLRHIALNLLRQDTTTKLGIKNKRLQAAWDENYLLALLAQ
jgi:predicted transposase YbfD/YdcC